MKKMLKVRGTVSDFCLNSNTRPYPTASLKNKKKKKKTNKQTQYSDISKAWYCVKYGFFFFFSFF